MDVWMTRKGEPAAVLVLSVQTINSTDKLWVYYRRCSGTGRTARRMRIWMPLSRFVEKFKPGKAIE